MMPIIMLQSGQPSSHFDRSSRGEVQPEFGDGRPAGFERTANELAPNPYSWEINTRWHITNQFCKQRLWPKVFWCCNTAFHTHGVKSTNIQKIKLQISKTVECL